MDTLSSTQRALVDRWLPDAVVEEDLGWGLVATTVLRVRDRDGRLCVVKAGGPSDHHIAREIRAHLVWTGPWVRAGLAPALLHHDAVAKVLVTRWLPGRLVLDDPAADEPATYRQAGRLLATLHAGERHVDATYEAREDARTRRWLATPHRIPAATARRVSAVLDRLPTSSAVLVPTHGDWQPRNWLVHDDEVRVIDLGRADLRPAASDLVRLSTRDFRRDPRLEAAFLDGYGSDPREAATWSRLLLREAVGTAAWAHQVGDEAFEREGLDLLAEALDRL